MPGDVHLALQFRVGISRKPLQLQLALWHPSPPCWVMFAFWDVEASVVLALGSQLLVSALPGLSLASAAFCLLEKQEHRREGFVNGKIYVKKQSGSFHGVRVAYGWEVEVGNPWVLMARLGW